MIALFALCCLYIAERSYSNWHLITIEPSFSLQEDVIQTLVIQKPSQQASLTMNELTQYEWFGRVEQTIKEATPELDIEALPLSDLNIALIGCFVEHVPSQSSALLSVDNKEAKWIKLGDNITAGTTLHSVNRHSVVLARDDKHEVVRMGGNIVTKSIKPQPTNTEHSLAASEQTPSAPLSRTGVITYNKNAPLNNSDIRNLLMSRINQHKSAQKQ